MPRRLCHVLQGSCHIHLEVEGQEVITETSDTPSRPVCNRHSTADSPWKHAQRSDTFTSVATHLGQRRDGPKGKYGATRNAASAHALKVK